MRGGTRAYPVRVFLLLLKDSRKSRSSSNASLDECSYLRDDADAPNGQGAERDGALVAVALELVHVPEKLVFTLS